MLNCECSSTRVVQTFRQHPAEFCILLHDFGWTFSEHSQFSGKSRLFWARGYRRRQWKYFIRVFNVNKKCLRFWIHWYSTRLLDNIGQSIWLMYIYTYTNLSSSTRHPFILLLSVSVPTWPWCHKVPTFYTISNILCHDTLHGPFWVCWPLSCLPLNRNDRVCATVFYANKDRRCRPLVFLYKSLTCSIFGYKCLMYFFLFSSVFRNYILLLFYIISCGLSLRREVTSFRYWFSYYI